MTSNDNSGLYPHLSPADADTLRRATAYLDQITAARAALRQLNVIRNNGDLIGGFSEWLAAALLRIDLIPATNATGHDAKDDRGRLYQIKGRQIIAGKQLSWDGLRPHQWDFLIGVVYAPESFRVLLVCCIESDYAEKRLMAGGRFRWLPTDRHNPYVPIVWQADKALLDRWLPEAAVSASEPSVSDQGSMDTAAGVQPDSGD